MKLSTYRIHKDGRICNKPFLVESFSYKQMRKAVPWRRLWYDDKGELSWRRIRSKEDVIRQFFGLIYCPKVWRREKPLTIRSYRRQPGIWGKLTNYPDHPRSLSGMFFFTGGDE